MAIEQHSILIASAFPLVTVPLCLFEMGMDSSSGCLGVYQKKQMPCVLIFSLLTFLSWLHDFLGNFSVCLGPCT